MEPIPLSKVQGVHKLILGESKCCDDVKTKHTLQHFCNSEPSLATTEELHKHIQLFSSAYKGTIWEVLQMSGRGGCAVCEEHQGTVNGFHLEWLLVLESLAAACS